MTAIILGISLMAAILAFVLNGVRKAPIYKWAREKDAYNGNHTAILGKYSILKIHSTKVTEASLNEWYANIVAVNNHMYDLIVYADRPGIGVHAHTGIVRVNIKLVEDQYGDYKNGGATDETYTLVPDEKTHTLIRSEM